MNFKELRKKGKAHARWYNKHIKALQKGDYETAYLDIWEHVIGHVEEEYNRTQGNSMKYKEKDSKG